METEELKNLPGEEWIDVIGFDGVYSVSNLGRVKSEGRWCDMGNGKQRWIRERILKHVVSYKHSSVRVVLCSLGVCKPFIVSRLVFFSFNYNVKNLPEFFVIHKNNDFRDNRLENLKIGTLSELANLTLAHGKFEHLKLGNPLKSKHARNTGVFSGKILTSKDCVRCKKHKPVDEFRVERNTCKECTRTIDRDLKRSKKKHAKRTQP